MRDRQHDVDNDGDQDLLLSGVSRETGMLTTRLLNNPLIGGGDNFSDIAISLPGLKRGSTSGPTTTTMGTLI